MALQRPESTANLEATAGPLVVGLVVFCAQLPFFDLWFNFMDEGHMVQFADMARRGQAFYRDATFYPLPGAFYFLTLIFEIFGPSVIVSRWVVMIQFTLFVVLVFLLLRRTTNLACALGGVACMLVYRVWCFPHWHIYSYSTTSLLVLLTALLVMAKFFDTGDKRILGAAGLLFGLGVLCKQDYGAAALVTFSVGLVAWRIAQPTEQRPAMLPLLGWFFVPAALVGAATGLYFWWIGVLGDLLQFTVFNHFTGMSAYHYMEFPSLFPLFEQDLALRTRLGQMSFLPGIVYTTDWPFLRLHWLYTDTPAYDIAAKLYYFGPPLLVTAALLRLVLRWRVLAGERGPEERQRYAREMLLSLFAATLILLVWLNKPQDYLHLAVLYWPLVCIVVVWAYSALRGRRIATVVTLLVLAVPAASLVAYSGRMLGQFRAAHTELIEAPRSGIRARPAEAVMLKDVLDYVAENSEPGERVAAIPYFPIINFLAERDGPHRSAYIVWPFPEIPDRDEQVVAAMEATNTDLVIYNFTQFFDFTPVWQHAPVIFEYLVEHFEIDRVFSHNMWGYKLVGLKRVEPESERPGKRIIPPDAAGVSVTLLGDGPPRPVPPGSRGVYIEEALWPFRRTIALRSSTAGRRTAMSIDVAVPGEGGRLRSAVAIHPQWWFKLPPSWVRFSVAVNRDGAREEIFSRTLNPTVILADRDWFDVDVPLDRWSGETITLEFVNEAERPRGETIWMGGWEVPRLVPNSS
jgi:hypothetical protein